MAKTYTSKQIHLKGVRLSYPSLFKTEVYNGTDTENYATTFLIPKSDKKLKKEIDEAIKALLEEARVKVASDKICIKDGDDSEADGYADNWTIKASKKKKQGRVKLINRHGNKVIVDLDGKIITQDNDGNVTDDKTNEDEFYQGCYVYGIITFWLQDNSFGKRVNANLLAIKLVKDGERLKGGSGSAEDFDEDFQMDDDDL